MRRQAALWVLLPDAAGCTFESTYTRGRAPSVPAASDADDTGMNSVSAEDVTTMTNKSPLASDQRRYSVIRTPEAPDHSTVGLQIRAPSSNHMAPTAVPYGG